MDEAEVVEADFEVVEEEKPPETEPIKQPKKMKRDPNTGFIIEE
jgi:hypothetical protein